MPGKDSQKKKLTIEPLTLKNWDKFVALFGDRGACANCWCMYYRLDNKSYKEGQKARTNKTLMHNLVKSGRQVGLLGILNGEAVGWIAFSPREDFIRLGRSRIHKSPDNEKVWSVPCFFTGRKFRGKGVSGEMLRGAMEYAKANGITAIEGYPVIPVSGKMPDAFAWYGMYSIFGREGFKTISDKSPNRPLVRFYLQDYNSPDVEV